MVLLWSNIMGEILGKSNYWFSPFHRLMKTCVASNIRACLRDPVQTVGRTGNERLYMLLITILKSILHFTGIQWREIRIGLICRCLLVFRGNLAVVFWAKEEMHMKSELSRHVKIKVCIESSKLLDNSKSFTHLWSPAVVTSSRNRLPLNCG